MHARTQMRTLWFLHCGASAQQSCSLRGWLEHSAGPHLQDRIRHALQVCRAKAVTCGLQWVPRRCLWFRGALLLG